MQSVILLIQIGLQIYKIDVLVFIVKQMMIVSQIIAIIKLQYAFKDQRHAIKLPKF
jgi:hypothetical protein